MQAPVTHILPLTTIRRDRRLPVPGQVIVHRDQTVTASEVIAEGQFAREHVLLDVARELRISADAADTLIKCKVGDKLSQDAIVAEGSGLLPRDIRVPRSGRVAAVGGGQVLIEVGETNLELRAGFPGTVVELIPNYGAIIQARGALIQGIWGNGRSETGLMLSVMEKPDEVLTAARLDVSLRGSIILGGHCRDADVLKAAAELPLRGLILSSIHPGLLTMAVQMRYAIVVTDGFGAQPMNSMAYKLLSTNLKRETTLNAEAYDRYTGARPEIFIPLPVSQEPPEPRETATFATGQQVRLLRAPHAGSIATIVNLPSALVQLPSGLRAQAANVRFENGESLLVPLVNLEVVG